MQLRQPQGQAAGSLEDGGNGKAFMGPQGLHEQPPNAHCCVCLVQEAICTAWKAGTSCFVGRYWRQRILTWLMCLASYIIMATCTPGRWQLQTSQPFSMTAPSPVWCRTAAPFTREVRQHAIVAEVGAAKSALLTRGLFLLQC
jgi:hypothetical protein